MTDEEEIKAGAEMPKYRHLLSKYLVGCGVDIGTGGFNPAAANSICIEQDAAAFARYTQNRVPTSPIHLTCGAFDLPFKDATLDYLVSSHFLEDVYDWLPVLKEWARVIKIGGYLVILVPDKTLWNQAIERGQPPNCEHRHESRAGELTWFMDEHFKNFTVFEDRLTALTPDDYTILFAARRTR